ncbi:AAA family ATPase [Microvirga subterranea]|uniref:Putative kinase n=1 Tax=Microvirga subterranea TaxID=186651 RepID=A0A370HED7_9HYPH|nr:AAA family ATPase [Microvirga subterranea]RDI55146.1 putative kinase [Microvirga subterranea]
MTSPRPFIITGAMAAGKSTTAESLARRLDPSVHLRGDVFRKMIVNGAAPMGPELSVEALRQLALRRRLACDAAQAYVEAGFSVVYQDILIGDALQEVAERLRHLSPAIVVLAPAPEVLAERDEARSKTGYGPHFPPTILTSALKNETPRLGLWIDNADLTVDEVVDRILAEFAGSAQPRTT